MSSAAQHDSMPSPSASTAPTLQNSKIDYHSHPDTPSWVSDLNKRLIAAEAVFTTVQELQNKNQELIALLLTAQFRISELETKLARVTIESPTVPVAPVQPSTSPKAVSFSDITTSIPAPTYASITAASAPPRRPRVSKAAAARTFTPVSATYAFEHLYFHCRSKEPISTMRSKLRAIGLQCNRILDIYYPDNNIVGLLIHSDYAPTVLDKFRSCGIEDDKDFDPLSPIIIRDPKFASLSDIEKKQKVLDLVEKRLINVIKRTTNKTKQYSLARIFLNHDWINNDQFASLFPSARPSATSSQVDSSMS